MNECYDEHGDKRTRLPHEHAVPYTESALHHLHEAAHQLHQAWEASPKGSARKDRYGHLADVVASEIEKESEREQ